MTVPARPRAVIQIKACGTSVCIKGGGGGTRGADCPPPPPDSVLKIIIDK